ncbi:MAG: hypothetical protein CL758_01360 [Chloroflexi bacterium]|nr:hypothetical protein [Chloroflexota bacterium]|tara:strand:- start:36 stop:623 length:588 start_codon:yes stop_codon:yes gene_type:complete
MVKAEEIMEIFNKHRGDAIIFTAGTAGYKTWPEISNNKNRDAIFGGAMGASPAIALGFALSQPNQKIVLFDAEGSLLMNLGVLSTIAEQNPGNFYHILLDNETYATTGGQPVPSSNKTSYDGLAKSAGYKSTYNFTDLEEFAVNIESILEEEGPTFISMKIEPDIENLPIELRPPLKLRPAQEVISDLRKDLNIS